MTDVNETLNSRANTHGDFRDNGFIMQLLKNCMRNFGRNWPQFCTSTTYTNGYTFSSLHASISTDNGKLTPEQCEALDMIQHKIGRILSGNPNEPDHWHDIAGYATLVENILRTGNSHITNPSA